MGENHKGGSLVRSSAVSFRPETRVEIVKALPPSPDELPRYPVAWMLFCTSAELDRGPLSRRFMGTRVVAFRTASGRVTALHAACSHMGCDLGRGTVVGESIQCPFHQWRFGPDGRCTHIPAQDEIPESARQCVFPSAEFHGMVFVFNGPEALYPPPFFDVADPMSIRPSRPFQEDLRCPWFMIGCNAYDLQHLHASHDRTVTGTPEVSTPNPYARRMKVSLRVAGTHWRDRVMRRVVGDSVTFTVVDWCGTLTFVTASFRRTTNYGMVAVEPLEDGRTRVIIRAFVGRSRSWIGSALFDPINAAVRRYFIREFLMDDAVNLDGIGYKVDNLLPCDGELVAYFRWLAGAAQGARLSADGEVGMGAREFES